MGIRIDGASDLINATDGSLTIEGQSLNTTGIVTASGGMKVGSAATIHSTGQFNIGVAATIFPSGNATFAGIITATGDINATGNLTGAQGHFTDHIYIADTICHTGDTNTKIRFPSADTISVETGGSERARVTSTGNLLVGVTAVEDWDGSRSHRIQVRGSTYQTAGISILDTQNDDNACELVLGKSRGTGNTIVQSADDVGQIRFAANDGAGFHSIAYIRGSMDGTPGSDDLPSKLTFGTSADGGATVSEHMRIMSTGDISMGPAGNAEYDDITGGAGLCIGGGSSSNAGIMIRTSSSGTGRIYFGDNSGDDDGRKDGFITYNQTDRDMIFGAERSERFRILSTGALVTGTTNAFKVTHTGGACMILERNSKQFSFNANYAAADTFSTFDVSSGMGYKFYCNGNPYITISSSGVLSGDLNDTSDEKKKKNITSIPDGAIANIKQLRPVTFNWKDPENLDKKSGFIAQEVKPIIPNLVVGEEYHETENTAGYSISTSGVVAHLTKALQEAITKIETLETKVAALESA
jgi:hypothetical protein